MGSQTERKEGQPRLITLPLRTLILGSNAILVVGLVLGISLLPYFLSLLAKITGVEKGAITYGQFRKLSAGMSETAVLASMSEPYEKTPQGQWVYFRNDGYVVTLAFVKGKLRSINEFKVVPSE